MWLGQLPFAASEHGRPGSLRLLALLLSCTQLGSLQQGPAGGMHWLTLIAPACPLRAARCMGVELSPSRAWLMGEPSWTNRRKTSRLAPPAAAMCLQRKGGGMGESAQGSSLGGCMASELLPPSAPGVVSLKCIIARAVKAGEPGDGAIGPATHSGVVSSSSVAISWAPRSNSRRTISTVVSSFMHRCSGVAPLRSFWLALAPRSKSARAASSRPELAAQWLQGGGGWVGGWVGGGARALTLHPRGRAGGSTQEMRGQKQSARRSSLERHQVRLTVESTLCCSAGSGCHPCREVCARPPPAPSLLPSACRAAPLERIRDGAARSDSPRPASLLSAEASAALNTPGPAQCPSNKFLGQHQQHQQPITATHRAASPSSSVAFTATPPCTIRLVSATSPRAAAWCSSAAASIALSYICANKQHLGWPAAKESMRCGRAWHRRQAQSRLACTRCSACAAPLTVQPEEGGVTAQGLPL